MTYSKEDQLGRSPGGRCVHGNAKTKCDQWECIGRRNRKSGLRKQRKDGGKLAKALGETPRNLSNEETARLSVRFEEKSGRQAEGVWKFYDECKAQSDAATPIGSMYPFIALAAAPFPGPGLAVLKLDDLHALFNQVRRGLL